jgi:bacteriophage CI repressor helix-turn-helix domain
MENFNARFERLLIEKGKNKADIADAVGISRTGMSSWKDNDRIPRADVAVKIAKILDVPVDYLVLGEDIELKPGNGELPVRLQELSQGQQSVVNSLVDLLKSQTLTPEGTAVGTRWQMLPPNKQQIILDMMSDMEAAQGKRE